MEVAAVEVSCAKCENKGWFQDGNRKFRCALCHRVPPKSVKLGAGEIDLDGIPTKAAESDPDEGGVLMICRVKDCGRTTTKKKPYCTRHILRMDYPNKVSDWVRRGEKEVARARAGRKVSPKGIIPGQIAIALLEKGDRSPERLAVDVDLVRPGSKNVNRNRSGRLALRTFLRTMWRARLVRIEHVRSTRGGMRLVVKLTPIGHDFAVAALVADGEVG